MIGRMCSSAHLYVKQHLAALFWTPHAVAAFSTILQPHISHLDSLHATWLYKIILTFLMDSEGTMAVSEAIPLNNGSVLYLFTPYRSDRCFLKRGIIIAKRSRSSKIILYYPMVKVGYHNAQVKGNDLVFWLYIFNCSCFTDHNLRKLK